MNPTVPPIAQTESPTTGRESTISDHTKAAAKAATSPETGPRMSGRKNIRQRFFREKALDNAPLSLTHDRIYILPTRRGWMFLASLLVMLIASMNYSLSLGYALCFLLTGLFSSTLLATYRNVSNISVARIEADFAIEGSTQNFNILFRNPRDLPCHQLSIRSAEGFLAATSLPAGETRGANLAPIARYRGWQHLGRFTLFSEYPLGLWITWGYMHIPARAIVWPRAETHPPPIPSRSPAAQLDSSLEVLTATNAALSNQGEFAHLREYRLGDSPSAIAWKSVARGTGMLSREFTQTEASTDLVLHWEDTVSAGDTELRVSRLAAWCQNLQQQNRSWELVLPTTTVANGSGNEHLRHCMDALALFRPPQHRTS